MSDLIADLMFAYGYYIMAALPLLVILAAAWLIIKFLFRKGKKR